MESFYRTHAYLVEHTNAPVRRDLMDEIDWSDRPDWYQRDTWRRKTTFLLQYAKEKFGNDRSCLFINMNNFYFSVPQHCRLRQRISETWRKSIVDRPGVQTSGMEQRVTHVLRPFS